MKTGVTGATGHLGRIVINLLKERNQADNIVALVRSLQKAADMGIEVRQFDYDKPDILTASLQGIAHLLLISANEVGKREQQHLNIIKAAKEAGVKWIIYTSLLRADSSSLSLAGEHLATENAIKETGIPYTFLRNGWYTENYTGSVGGALASGALVGSAGNGKISSASRSDYAEAAVTVLTGTGHQGKIYELAGDTYFTLSDLAAEISRQSGKNIPYKNLPESEYAEALKSFGVPENYALAIAGWDVSASKGDLFDDGKQLSHLIGHSTTPLSVSVSEALKMI